MMRRTRWHALFTAGLAPALCCGVWGQAATPKPDPLEDWSLWERYRASVSHPAATFKAADLARARANIVRYRWAREYRDKVERTGQEWIKKITPDFLDRMIPATTPGALLFTPCPACRDQKKPPHSHGQWAWSPRKPEQIVCDTCATVFPDSKYPENIVQRANYGGGQVFTYYGGEPFPLFSYKTGRPSFTGAIRSRKVSFMATLCHNLAEAYALTGTFEYADAARRILLRFAQVYPNWLVHSGYGEYADMDPHIAARSINALPSDELRPPPTPADRKLHAGYWMAGRATASGQEGQFVRRVLEAYDLTCEAVKNGKALYSTGERRTIEKDLLLESTILLTADKAVNNKSVANGTATTLVGMALGHPELVRFGLGFFEETVNRWFLPDGGTPESWSYALMTLNGIQALGQAFRGYSDPPGYKDASGKRLDKINLYENPAYRRVWAAMFRGLQGDLRYPPLADGHRKDGLGARYAELMAANYPENGQYLALLRAIAGDDLAGGDAATAVYQREPGRETKPSPPLFLPDHLFPALQIGYLRGGPAGRDSALILSASGWGSHHHRDSLSLYWWHNGRELLSDLGYLWDHPQMAMTARTLAHNTILVDGSEQATTGRGGRFVLFSSGGSGVKVMEAESRAYPQADLYRRTVAQVGAAPGRGYVVDIFRVRGGERHDYVFHGPSTDFQAVGGSLPAWREPASSTLPPLDLRNLRRVAPASGNVRLTWATGDGTEFTALWPAEAEELSLIGDGWGQRDFGNADAGATLPYIVRRRVASTSAPTVFAGVFEGHREGAGIVQSVRRLPVPPSERDNVTALQVETTTGVDYIVSCREPRPVTLMTGAGPLEVSGRFAVVRTVRGNAAGSFLAEGERLRWRGKALGKPGAAPGRTRP